MSSANLGIPIRLIHESLGHIITVETKGGVSYRGQLYDGAFIPLFPFQKV
jgi:small nuclear ribonucleoprotein (snRNP)-like protein